MIGSGKGLIASLGLKTIRRPKNIKKARFDINEVIVKDISKIIKEFKDTTNEGYMRKRSKHMPTESYFYLARYLAKCMTSNLCGPEIAQKMSTQKMGNYKMSTQILLIIVSVIQTRENQKGSMLTRANKTMLTSKYVL